MDKAEERAANIAAQEALEDDTVKTTSSADALVGGEWGDVVITFSNTGLQATAFDGDVKAIDLSPTNTVATTTTSPADTTSTVDTAAEQEAAAALAAAAASVQAQLAVQEEAAAAAAAAAAQVEEVSGSGAVPVTVQTAIATPVEVGNINTLYVSSATANEAAIPAPPSQDAIIEAAIDAAFNTVEPTKAPTATPTSRPTLQAKDNTIAQGKALCQMAMYIPALTKLSFGTSWQGGAKCPANDYVSGTPSWCSWQGVSCTQGDVDKSIPFDVNTLKISGDYYRQSEGISGLLPSGTTLPSSLPLTLFPFLPSFFPSLSTLISYLTPYLTLSRCLAFLLVGFGLLTGLETLAIDHTYLSGPLPTAIGSFDRLHSLVVSHNDFDGSIPTSISELASLTTLTLDHNHLTGDIPYSFAKLKKLSDLNLGYNSMSSSIPTMMGAMFSLKTLNLAHMSLRGTIPNSMGLLSGLTSMQLQYNSLSGAVPTSFSKLVNVAPDLSSNPYLGMNTAETKVMMSANPFVVVPDFTATTTTTEEGSDASSSSATQVKEPKPVDTTSTSSDGTGESTGTKKRGVGGKVHDSRRR